MNIPSNVEGENSSGNKSVEGEYQDDTYVEGEHNDTETINVYQNDGFHELNDNNSVAGSENEEIYEDAPLDFDPTYPPLEKWTRNHPKEQVIGNP